MLLLAPFGRSAAIIDDNNNLYFKRVTPITIKSILPSGPLEHNSLPFEIFLSPYQACLRGADFLENYRLFLNSVSVYKH